MIALCIKLKKQKREFQSFSENLYIKLNIFNFCFNDTECEVDHFLYMFRWKNQLIPQ